MSSKRFVRGENRFYNPPPMRKLQQEREEKEKKRLQQEEDEKRKKKTAKQQVRQRNAPPIQELTRSPATAAEEKEKKRAASSASSDCSVSGRVMGDETSNLDRFLECTTPVIPAQYLPRTSAKGRRSREVQRHPYFLLNDVWESFEEWSAYGVGVPLLLNGGDSVVQYYVPYLSGIQLYVDPSRSGTKPRAGEDSDGDLPGGLSSDDSTDCPDIVQSLNEISLEGKQLVGSCSDENEISSESPSGLAFEYLEHGLPFGREPLADKIASLSMKFPALRTCRSCDLLPTSWVSVAWYPIYRVPLGQTLQNVEACFLTFHFLSTPVHGHSKNESNGSSKWMLPAKLSLPTFGLASYKLKMSIWSRDGNSVSQEQERAVMLLQAADDWLRQLHVILPDFSFFASHYTSTWR